MSLLNVSALQNVGAGAPNIVLNSDGSVTLAVYTNASTPPSPTQAGTLWFTGTALNIRNLANSAWVAAGGGGSGTVTNVTGTAPIVVATGSTTPAISITAATTGAFGSIQLATAAENAAGTDATKAVTPAYSVPKDAANMTGAAILPSGTTANRPSTPAAGMFRVNTTTQSTEAYVNGAWNTVASTTNGQLAGFRNILINGNFGINQRGYVSGTATTAAGQYTLDRWKVLTAGQSLTFVASGIGNQVTAPAGGLQQVIEDLMIVGGIYTLSWTGTATATVNGTSVTNGSQVTLPANTQATVIFSGGTVSNAQLEPGGAATPFENRTPTIETILCQRYFIFAGSGVTWSAGSLSGAGSNTVFRSFGFALPATMRSAPTVTFASNDSATGGTLSYMAGGAGGGAAITGDAGGGSGATTLAGAGGVTYVASSQYVARLSVGVFSSITWSGTAPPQGANYSSLGNFLYFSSEL